MKMTMNQAYKEAKYELGFMAIDQGWDIPTDPYPHRFNSVRPPEAYEDQDSLWKWVKEHSIPPIVAE